MRIYDRLHVDPLAADGSDTAGKARERRYPDGRQPGSSSTVIPRDRQKGCLRSLTRRMTKSSGSASRPRVSICSDKEIHSNGNGERGNLTI